MVPSRPFLVLAAIACWAAGVFMGSALPRQPLRPGERSSAGGRNGECRCSAALSQHPDGAVSALGKGGGGVPLAAAAPCPSCPPCPSCQLEQQSENDNEEGKHPPELPPPTKNSPGDRLSPRTVGIGTYLRRLQMTPRVRFGAGSTPDAALAPPTVMDVVHHDPALDRFVSRSIIEKQEAWESESAQLVAALLVAARQPGRAPLLVDVGANIGMFTMYSAHVGARVVALEGIPQNIAALSSSILRNNLQNNVFVVPMLASDVSGQVCDVFSSVINMGNSMMACGKTEAAVSEAGALLQSSESKTAHMAYMGSAMTIRIDDVVPPGEIVDVMKIDCQGCEWRALGGATRLFDEKLVKSVYMEFDPAANVLISKIPDPAQLLTFFTSRGCVFHDPETREPVNMETLLADVPRLTKEKAAQDFLVKC
jgi:FkbM family methyltransferase